MASSSARPFPQPARVMRARAGTAHAPVPLGRRVPRPRSRRSLRCVVDNRHHVLGLQTSTSTALLRNGAAEWAGALVRDLHLPIDSARQPVANGLRLMASAHDWGNPPRASTSPVAALSPNVALHLPSEAHWGRPKGRAGSKPADGPQPHSGCGIVAAAAAVAASPQPPGPQLPDRCVGAPGAPAWAFAGVVWRPCGRSGGVHGRHTVQTWSCTWTVVPDPIARVPMASGARNRRGTTVSLVRLSAS